MDTPAQLAPYVAGGAFLLAFVFGAVGNKTSFCTMGAFRVGVLEQGAVTLSTGQDLPSIAAGFGGSKQTWMVVLSLLFGLSFVLFAYSSRDFRSKFDHSLGGVVTGLVVVGGAAGS